MSTHQSGTRVAVKQDRGIDQIAPEHVIALKKIWDEVDINNDNALDLKELKMVFSKLHINLDDVQAKKVG